MTQLTTHFSLEELTLSQTAVRRGIDNTPSLEQVKNLKRVAAMLEDVRTLLGEKPVLISSGYRSPGVNAAVGGAKDSRHLLGLAADFTSPPFGPPKDICLKIAASDLPFDQLIYEGTWVHIGLAPNGTPPRKQLLTAHFQNGMTIYTPKIV
jgi:zinc D-Ala-D-Ala carboxypeptidase